MFIDKEAADEFVERVKKEIKVFYYYQNTKMLEAQINNTIVQLFQENQLHRIRIIPFENMEVKGIKASSIGDAIYLEHQVVPAHRYLYLTPMQEAVYLGTFNGQDLFIGNCGQDECKLIAKYGDEKDEYYFPGPSSRDTDRPDDVSTYKEARKRAEWLGVKFDSD